MSYTEDKSPTPVIGTNPGFHNGVVFNQFVLYQNVVGSLDSCDWKGVGNQYAGGVNLSFNATQVATVSGYTMDAISDYKEHGVGSSLKQRDYKDFTDRVVRRPEYIVRRLTPLECERLQGFPDHWTDIPSASDSKRYKALGNSIALPSWKWVLKRISAQYEADPTMASLFDGIGGFPYLWEGINGKGTCTWCSEIEEFPEEVTKERIG